MALQKQQIPIPLINGINTKTDDKQVIPPALLELENGVFIKPGKITKRNGYDLLSQKVVNQSEDITAALGLGRFRQELNLFDGTNIYSYLDALDRWTKKGSASSVTVSSKSVVRNSSAQSTQAGAANSSLEVYAWEDSRGGVRYSVLDSNSDTFIVHDVEISATAEQPKVIASRNFFAVFYIDGIDIKFTKIPVIDPDSIEAPVDLATNVDPTNKNYDVSKVGDRIFITWNDNNVGGGISTRYTDCCFSFGTSLQVAGENADACISVVGDSSLNIYVLYNDGTDTKYMVFDYNITTQVLAPTAIETISPVKNITAVETATDTVTALYEVENTISGIKHNYIKSNTADTAGTVGTPAIFQRSVGLASSAFTHDGNQYVAAAHESVLQSTYFLFSLNGDIVTKVGNGSAGGYTTKAVLPEMSEISTGKFLFPNLIKGDLQSEDGVLFGNTGVQSTTLDFTSLNNFITSELGNNMHIVGGILQSYDGISVTEKNFNIFPEEVTANIINVGAGNLADGTYQYSVVYAWQDNEGQIHRSAPSIPTTVVISGGPSDVEITYPTLRISKKSGIFVEIYRTEASKTLSYKLTSSTSPVANDPTIDVDLYTDTDADAAIITNEILYITGGVLDNIAPPPCSLMTTWKSRLVISGMEDDNLLWFSKERLAGEPVEFNDTLTLTTDSAGGKITALGVVDDKLVIFKDTRIFIQVGDGPNNLGQQSDFGAPELVTSDAGCIDPNSVVETPIGLMFKSRKGIYLLDRSLQVNYIGARVEKFNNSSITSATLVPNTNQVRFTTADNLCLVFDYFFQEWTTFSNHESVEAEVYENRFVFAKSDGRVYQENVGKYTDGADAIRMKIVTSWIQLGGVSGFQRVYKATLLGRYISPHTLKIKIGYDFNSAFTQDVSIVTGDIITALKYGEGSPYGADATYGGDNPLYQWHIHPKRQKCMSIRFSIEDFQATDYGEGYDISNIRLQIGVKSGDNKLSDEKSAGTE